MCGRSPRWALRRAHWAVPAGRGPVADLAAAIEPPAIGSAFGRDPAGGGDGASAHGVETHAARHGHWARPLGLGPVAELPPGIVSPAIGEAPSCDSAGLLEAGAHRAKAQAAPYGDRARPEGLGSVPELGQGVTSPAEGGAVRREPAAVKIGRASCRERV